MDHDNDRIIGITSTIPVEIIYASGNTPVDINNMFITTEDPIRYVRYAKARGFPDTTCSWICGLYGVIMEKKIRRVLCVVGGDCAETIALMEVLFTNGVEVIPFAYPHTRDREQLNAEMYKLAKRLGTDLDEARLQKKRLDLIRERIHHLDRLLWNGNRATGKEVQLFQLSASDFTGAPDGFHDQINEAISEIEQRAPFNDAIRLGFVGVPPIVTDLYDRIEQDGVRIVFSEVQRQFSMPEGDSLIDAYHRYTYPYGIYARLEDIQTQVKLRGIDGIIHYVQTFCYRGIEDMVLRERLKVPVLTLQGDLPVRVTETMQVRIEAFVDMLRRKKGIG